MKRTRVGDCARRLGVVSGMKWRAEAGSGVLDAEQTMDLARQQGALAFALWCERQALEKLFRALAAQFFP